MINARSRHNPLRGEKSRAATREVYTARDVEAENGLIASRQSGCRRSVVNSRDFNGSSRSPVKKPAA